MSFETTLLSAVEDFKAKFVGQHREAMKHEFSTSYGELTKLGILVAEKVAMMKDAHSSLNEAEKVLGVDLTPLPALGTALDGYEVAVSRTTPVETAKPLIQGERAKLRAMDVQRVRKAVRAFEKVRHSKSAGIKNEKRTELSRVMIEANANGMSWTVISRLAGRSSGWVFGFIKDTRNKGLI